MKVVNSLIFNSLARRESVNIPEVGSLRVERHSARLKGKERLELPATRIVFSKNETQGACSVVDLIERESGADRFKSEELYSKWLDETTKEKTITIDGVGRIKNDFFTPSPELVAVINPDAKSFIKLKKRGKTGTIALFCLLIIAVGVGGFMLVQETMFKPVTYSNRPAPIEFPAVPLIVSVPDTELTDGADFADENSASSATSGSSTSTSSVGTVAGSNKTGDTSLNVASASSTAVSGSGSGSGSGSVSAKFHIIAGVYSTIENAENFIAKSRLKADTLPYKILPLSSGKFLVSIFEASDEGTASRRRKVLQRGDPNVWVYKSSI